MYAQIGARPLNPPIVPPSIDKVVYAIYCSFDQLIVYFILLLLLLHAIKILVTN